MGPDMKGKGGFRPAGIKGEGVGKRGDAKVCGKGMYGGDGSLPVKTQGTMGKGGGRS